MWNATPQSVHFRRLWLWLLLLLLLLEASPPPRPPRRNIAP
jgi:hypothetical protein